MTWFQVFALEENDDKCGRCGESLYDEIGDGSQKVMVTRDFEVGGTKQAYSICNACYEKFSKKGN